MRPPYQARPANDFPDWTIAAAIMFEVVRAARLRRAGRPIPL